MNTEEFYEKLLGQYQRALPFVVYREPRKAGKILTKALLQHSDTLHSVSDYSESGFLFAPFHAAKEAVLIPAEQSEKLLLSNHEEPKGTVERELASSSPTIESVGVAEAKARHLLLVEKAKGSLQKGELEKVVLSRKERLRLEVAHPLELFQELLETYPNAFVYCWYHPQVGLWLGATPETLLQVEGSDFRTMALAGTQKFEGNMEVEWGEKEKQEQQYVTDSILENLGAFGLLDGLQVSDAYTSRAGNLLHLRTDISGRLQSLDKLQEILASLHPTPAVCGLPKEEAKQFILKEEGYDREFYTGFLGELNMQEKRQRSGNTRNVENLAYAAVRKKTSLYVNLRCMKLEQGWAHLYIGGGITKESIPEAEWEETINKAQTMKRPLMNFIS